jgi:hypothetical protein
VGADAIVEAVVHRAEVQLGLHRPEGSLDLGELLVPERGILGGKTGVGDPDDVLTIELLVGGDGGAADRELAALQLANPDISP